MLLSRLCIASRFAKFCFANSLFLKTAHHMNPCATLTCKAAHVMLHFGEVPVMMWRSERWLWCGKNDCQLRLKEKSFKCANTSDGTYCAFEVLYLSISIFCSFILPLPFILETDTDILLNWCFVICLFVLYLCGNICFTYKATYKCSYCLDVDYSVNRKDSPIMNCVCVCVCVCVCKYIMYINLYFWHFITCNIEVYL